MGPGHEQIPSRTSEDSLIRSEGFLGLEPFPGWPCHLGAHTLSRLQQAGQQRDGGELGSEQGHEAASPCSQSAVHTDHSSRRSG